LNYRWPSWYRKACRERAALWRWPISSMKERVVATRPENLYQAAAVATDFPMRAIRYWWTYCAIMDEAKRYDRPLTIVDAGCGRGISRRFVGDDPNAKWIGLDWQIDRQLLLDRGYDEVHQCDLDKPLPLADGCADVVIFQHVAEHLPRISFTLHELARLLHSEAVLVAGSPIRPRLLCPLQELRYRRADAMGKRAVGAHINALHVGLWRDLLTSVGLEVETLSGAHFFRWSGSPLENYAWWLRANLMWGALLPAWGRELYIVARK